MKIIKWKVASGENFGTDETPDITRFFNEKWQIYTEAAYSDALKEAYNGEVTIENVEDTRPLHEIRSEKEQKLSGTCNAVITAGIDVETTQGTEHFSLEETDQINLTTALSAVQAGDAVYPYHADGKLCRMFTAEEIQTIASTAIFHTLYHRTLCNHLLMWARRAETAAELESITYTEEGMPDDLAQNMEQILTAAGEKESA